MQLETTIKHIQRLVREGERGRLAAARQVALLKENDAYQQLGYATWKAFLKDLMTQLAGVGWKADRTVRNWLDLISVYIDQYDFSEDDVVAASSHLVLLLPLIGRDRQTGEVFSDETKPIPDVEDFGTLASVIIGLVSLLSTDERTNGLNAREFTERFGAAAAVVNRLSTVPVVVAGGGWTVKDTKELADRIKGKEPKTKVKATPQAFVRQKGKKVVLSELNWLGEDGTVILSVPVNAADEIDIDTLKLVLGEQNVRWD